MNALLVSADSDGWGHMDGWGGAWMWLWGPLIMIGFVALIYFAVRTGYGPASRDPVHRAREILAERFARGEITAEDYHKRVDELRR